MAFANCKEPWKTLDPLDTPDAPTEFSIHFENGVPVKVVLGGDQGATDSIELFKLLNKIGHDNGVGRIDIVGTRLVGITSRGC
jgi:argininosuccinate synthase